MAKCGICEKEFRYVSWKHLRYKHDLSLDEYRAMGHRTGVEKDCPVCDKMFIPDNRKQITCGAKCGYTYKSQVYRGKNHHGWGKSRSHTEEAKRKISKNNARYWQGKKRGPRKPEVRLKISKAMSEYLADCATRNMYPYQSGYYKSPIAGQVWLHSSYEFRFAAVLDKLGWQWMRNDKIFSYQDASGTPRHSVPDFKVQHIETGKVYYETKDWLNNKESHKVMELQKQIPLVVLTEDLLRVYERLTGCPHVSTTHGVYRQLTLL